MLLKLISQVIFYGLSGILALYGAIMIYVLLRFGKSKLLGLVIAVFYILLMVSLYSAASVNFDSIIFPNL